MKRDPRVEDALRALRGGAHDAWITLHPVGANEQRALVTAIVEGATRDLFYYIKTLELNFAAYKLMHGEKSAPETPRSE